MSDRTSVWKMLYSPGEFEHYVNPSPIAIVSGEQHRAQKRAARKTDGFEDDFPLHENIPWLPASSVAKLTSALYREMPAGLDIGISSESGEKIQIEFIPSVADKIMTTLRNSSEDVLDEIKSVVIHEGVELSGLRDLHEIVAPHVLTMTPPETSSETELTDFLAGFSDSVKDLGIVSVNPHDGHSAIFSGLPGLERLRFSVHKNKYIHNNRRVRNVMDIQDIFPLFEQMKTLTHLIFHCRSLRDKTVRDICQILERVRCKRLNYLQIGDIIQDNYYGDLIRILASLTYGLYVQEDGNVKNDKWLSADEIPSGSHIGIVETCLGRSRNQDSATYYDKKFKTFFPEWAAASTETDIYTSLSDGNRGISQLVIFNDSLNFLSATDNSLFVLEDRYMQTYYNPDSFARKYKRIE